jgi:hypothetical protein
MYVNRKMITVETIPEMGGGGEHNYDVFDTM